MRISSVRRAYFGIAALVIGLAPPLSAQTAPAAGENTGPNANIVRWAEGKYIYLGDNGTRERGIEKFRLNVHPDGTRTLVMWHDLYARNLQYTVVLRVTDNFRPLEAFTSYWSPGGFKGTVLVRVKGDTLETESHGPLGTYTQTIAVPEKLSVGTHPVSGDGWHMWYDDPKAKGVQKTGMTYGLDPGGDMSKPVLGILVQQQFENLGKEKITVPAGTFDTVHYKIAGFSDAWVTMPDRILIKMSTPSRGIDYELVEFASGDNAAAK